MPARTQKHYKALYRDFERLDYFIDSTATKVSKPSCLFSQKKFAKAAWDAMNKRTEVFENCIKNDCFETCEAQGFWHMYSNKYNNENLQSMIDWANVDFLRSIEFYDSDDLEVYGNSILSFMNYSLEDMKGYLKNLANGESVSQRHKTALDGFLDQCAKAGSCIKIAMNESPTNATGKKHGMPSLS